MASIFEQLMAQNRELTVEPKKVVKTESRKIPVKKIKLESRKIYEEEDLDAIDDKFSIDMDKVEDPESDEVVLVIDPELPAEGEEEPEAQAEDMVGDMVYKCPVCGANYLCDCDHLEEEGIEVDDEGTPVACPICGDEADQILVGEIAPAEDVKPEDETETEPVEPEDAEKDDEGEAEDEVKIDFDEKEEVEEESVKAPVMPRAKRRREFVTADGKTRKGGDPVAFAGKAAREKALKGKVSSSTVADAKRQGINIDADTADVVVDSVRRPARRPMPRRPMVKENKLARRPSMRPVARLTQRTRVESFEIDDFRFESLMNKHFAENYKGNPVCKLRDASIDRNNTLRLEYVIRNGNKKPVKGMMTVENFRMNENRKNYTFTVKDSSKTFSNSNRPTFQMECVRIGNKLNPVALRYNYVRKVKTESYQVSGKVSLKESKGAKR